MALLGLMLHAIDEMVDDGNLKWNMSEWLAGAIPASAHHHTAAWIKGATNTACNQLGVARPEQKLFIKTADQGANMAKAWGPGRDFKNSRRIKNILKVSWRTFDFRELKITFPFFNQAWFEKRKFCGPTVVPELWVGAFEKRKKN